MRKKQGIHIGRSTVADCIDDFDVNSSKLGSTVAKRNEKLVKLLNGVADMNLGDVRHHDMEACIIWLKR